MNTLLVSQRFTGLERVLNPLQGFSLPAEFEEGFPFKV
jgi:hypothetical protein